MEAGVCVCVCVFVCTLLGGGEGEGRVSRWGRGVGFIGSL